MEETQSQSEKSDDGNIFAYLIHPLEMGEERIESLSNAIQILMSATDGETCKDLQIFI